MSLYSNYYGCNIMKFRCAIVIPVHKIILTPVRICNNIIITGVVNLHTTVSCAGDVLIIQQDMKIIMMEVVITNSRESVVSHQCMAHPMMHGVYKMYI